MSNSHLSKPAISIDLRRNCIRIYRRTLRSIGTPEYILLLVNPSDCTLAIQSSDHSDPRAYRLPHRGPGNRLCCEITSKSLMENLLHLCKEWQDGCLYRIYGEIVRSEGVVQFNLTNAVRACGTRE